ncbi:hypothetical protein AcW2_005215 [Taiwanofungus camphoratus]|nr:hypothetical protein AcW2_005215 [Antrodia cinnamomea]
MPGVTVLPPSPALGGFGSAFSSESQRKSSQVVPNEPQTAMQNGSNASHRDTVAEIKEVAKEQAQKVRGASAISLLKTARGQIMLAQAREGEGDLKGALSALTKAASLAQMFMDSSEFKQESQPGKKGVLVKDFLDFQQHEGRDLKGKTESVEAKLMEVERLASQDTSTSTSTEEESDAPARTTGVSIAERMRSLQNAGLAVSTTKRLSRDVSPAGSSTDVAKTNRLSLPTMPSPSMNLSALSSAGSGSPMAASASMPSPSPHALVPASSFGPPSPSSSASSSPRLSHLSIADFAQAFPSIDEIDEIDGLELPSVPTGTGSTGSRSGPHTPLELRAERPLFVPSKPFPVLPMDLGPRPSSTPIPPTIDTFISRPASPARSPLSPTVPRKPSGLSLRSMSSRSPVLPPVPTPATPGTEKPPDLPGSTLFPKTLLEYNNRNNFKVLVLDVRTRDEFEKEHVKADAVVCIEPSVLLREKVTAQSVEDALSVAPRDEWVLFSNRDKFDLVAVYDASSETFGDSHSPLSILVRAIYETAFRKFLKHPPMLLVGGLQSWKQEFGEAELVRGATSTSSDPGRISSLVNGIASPRLNGIIAPAASYPEPKTPAMGHSRTPASHTPATISATSIAEMDGVVHGRNRAGTEPSVDTHAHTRWIPSQPNPRYSVDRIPVSLRPGSDKDTPPYSQPIDPTKRLVRKSAISRPPSNSISFPYNPPIPESTTAQHVTPSLINGSSPIQYPSVSRNISPQISGSSFSSSPGLNGLVSMPPQASINPSPLSRRRSDIVDQSQEALSNLTTRPSIDYPDLSSQHILRPPPAVAASGMERQDNRPRLMQQSQSFPMSQIGTSGLKNLGNTCYMNATIQCLSATVPFARFFTDGRWKSAVNMVNPLGTKGNIAHAFANILRDMWQGELQCLSPMTFRRSICVYNPQYGGTEQHDSQEFLNSLLDGLHEDLNRVLHKPQLDSTPEREAELEKLPVQIASEQEWQIYRMRNDSLVVDFFQGQFRNRLECLTCHKTSTTYNTFMYLSLPIPSNRSGSKVSLHQCLDFFVKEEVMEKSDAWNCPYCKALRKATKQLSLSRLPPVLLIHLKRFSVKGHFTDKIETCVDFPLKGLDLTNYMPPPLPPGVGRVAQTSRDDPRSQMPPYRYDLYGVTNHFGTLSSGHYTAFISSRGGWLYCDDSRVSQADAKDVVVSLLHSLNDFDVRTSFQGRPAYMLFYKRTKA